MREGGGEIKKEADYLNKSFVREDVSEVKVLSSPVNSDASYSAFPDSVFDDLLPIASIRSNPEDSIVLVLLIVNPVDPLAVNVVVQMQNVMTWG